MDKVRENINLVIQAFSQNYKHGFDPYKLNPNDAYEFLDSKIIFKDGVPLENYENSTFVNLASTSKVLVIKALADLMVKKGISSEFEIDKLFIKELIYRKQIARIEKLEIYKDALLWINKNKKI